jgi:hypothetical protein
MVQRSMMGAEIVEELIHFIVRVHTMPFHNRLKVGIIDGVMM